MVPSTTFVNISLNGGASATGSASVTGSRNSRDSISSVKKKSMTSAITENNTLSSSQLFECSFLPPMNSLSGALVPRMFQKGRYRRLISLEIHRIMGDGKAISSYYDECVVRIFVTNSTEANIEAKQRAQARRRAKQAGKSEKAELMEEVEVSLIEDDEEESIVDVSPEFIDSGASIEGWKAKYRLPIKMVSIRGTHKHSVIVQVDLGKKKQVREMIFVSLQEAEKFHAMVEEQLALESERAEQKMNVAIGNTKSIRLDEEVTFLFEIVSGWDLPIGDFKSSDPYVSCIFEGEEVHRTDYISKTLDPIWTVSNGSLFLFRTVIQSLFRSDGLLCIVYDFDKVGGNKRLGAVMIPPRSIYNAKGERLEFKLGPPPGKTDEVSGYIAVRVRRATQNDIDFLDEIKQSGKSFRFPGRNVESETDSKGGASNIASILTRRSRIARTGQNAGKKEYRVRPTPDPERVEETTYMTKDQIEAECNKESTHWIDAGSGQLGRVFIEILGCDDLPNLDVGGFAGNKTDAFVSLVYEDILVQTDIIDDTLTPRWMPWSKRAFIFHMMHSSSQIFLGVFDYDEGINPTDDHDLVGRVSVDLSNLRKDTVYILKYNIYTTAQMTARKRKGSITVRLRIEIPDERKYLLSAVEPPPKMYVNVKTRREFRVVRYTCTGKYNMDKYSMKVINSYIEELLYLQHIVFYLQDAAMTLLLWRGTFPIPIPYNDHPWMFPIHSLSAFATAILLVENPQLIPSFFFASIAWVLLASQAYRRSLPDVWSRCKSYKELLKTLAIGESSEPPELIGAYHNYQEAQTFLDKWQKRIEDAEVAAAKAYEEQVKAQEEYEREMEDVGGEEDIATKSGGMSFDPFKSLLFPVQQNLGLVCRYVRHVKHVLSWQECYIAFWITTACILLAVVCFFLPWFFFIKWGARLVAWTVFGPWMKLVDVYYVSKITPLTETELLEKKQRERNQRVLQTSTAVAAARIKREDVRKLKAMKKLLFGRFIIRVPLLKEDRYRDLPLPESTAVPFLPSLVPMSEVAMADAGYRKIRLPGQHLVGVMIPTIESVGFTEAPIGQPTAHPMLVDKNGLGGTATSGIDSTAAAYLRLGSLVFSAAVLTWFGVPFLTSLTHWVLLFLKHNVEINSQK